MPSGDIGGVGPRGGDGERRGRVGSRGDDGVRCGEPKCSLHTGGTDASRPVEHSQTQCQQKTTIPEPRHAEDDGLGAPWAGMRLGAQASGGSSATGRSSLP